MLHLFTSLTLLTLPLVLADPLVTTTATTPLPTQGQPCTSGNAFCVAGPIIARCDTGVIGTRPALLSSPFPSILPLSFSPFPISPSSFKLTLPPSRGNQATATAPTTSASLRSAQRVSPSRLQVPLARLTCPLSPRLPLPAMRQSRPP